MRSLTALNVAVRKLASRNLLMELQDYAKRERGGAGPGGLSGA